MVEVRLSEEQWLFMFHWPRKDLFDWFRDEGIAVPTITGRAFKRYAVFPDAASATLFKLRWLA